jgi:hypothetical protein
MAWYSRKKRRIRKRQTMKQRGGELSKETLDEIASHYDECFTLIARDIHQFIIPDGEFPLEPNREWLTNINDHLAELYAWFYDNVGSDIITPNYYSRDYGINQTCVNDAHLFMIIKLKLFYYFRAIAPPDQPEKKEYIWGAMYLTIHHFSSHPIRSDTIPKKTIHKLNKVLKSTIKPSMAATFMDISETDDLDEPLDDVRSFANAETAVSEFSRLAMNLHIRPTVKAILPYVQSTDEVVEMTPKEAVVDIPITLRTNAMYLLDLIHDMVENREYVKTGETLSKTTTDDLFTRAGNARQRQVREKREEIVRELQKQILPNAEFTVNEPITRETGYCYLVVFIYSRVATGMNIDEIKTAFRMVYNESGRAIQLNTVLSFYYEDLDETGQAQFRERCCAVYDESDDETEFAHWLTRQFSNGMFYQIYSATKPDVLIDVDESASWSGTTTRIPTAPITTFDGAGGNKTDNKHSVFSTSAFGYTTKILSVGVGNPQQNYHIVIITDDTDESRVAVLGFHGHVSRDGTIFLCQELGYTSDILSLRNKSACKSTLFPIQTIIGKFTDMDAGELSGITDHFIHPDYLPKGARSDVFVLLLLHLKTIGDMIFTYYAPDIKWLNTTDGLLKDTALFYHLLDCNRNPPKSDYANIQVFQSNAAGWKRTSTNHTTSVIDASTRNQCEFLILLYNLHRVLENNDSRINEVYEREFSDVRFSDWCANTSMYNLLLYIFVNYPKIAPPIQMDADIREYDYAQFMQDVGAKTRNEIQTGIIDYLTSEARQPIRHILRKTGVFVELINHLGTKSPEYLFEKLAEFGRPVRITDISIANNTIEIRLEIDYNQREITKDIKYFEHIPDEFLSEENVSVSWISNNYRSAPPPPVQFVFTVPSSLDDLCSLVKYIYLVHNSEQITPTYNQLRVLCEVKLAIYNAMEDICPDESNIHRIFQTEYAVFERGQTAGSKKRPKIGTPGPTGTDQPGVSSRFVNIILENTPASFTVRKRAAYFNPSLPSRTLFTDKIHANEIGHDKESAHLIFGFEAKPTPDNVSADKDLYESILRILNRPAELLPTKEDFLDIIQEIAYSRKPADCLVARGGRKRNRKNKSNDRIRPNQNRSIRRHLAHVLPHVGGDLR